MNENQAGPSPERLMQMAWGYGPTLVVHAAVRVGLFDCLEVQPRTAEEVAAVTGASARGLRAVMGALVGMSLLRLEDERYGLTAESAAFLVSTKPEYRGGFFRHHVEQLLPQWMQLEEVLRTGQPVRRTNQGDHGEAHFAGFVESLFPGGYPAARALAGHLGLGRHEGDVRVLDLGAGSGVWGIALAQSGTHVRVKAVDWPSVLEVTRQVAGRHSVGEQMEYVAGDLFEADFGSGYDVAVLGHILHSEGPERIRLLLRKIRESLAPGGVLVIQEFVVDDDRRGPFLPLLFAVNMLVNTESGDTYSRAEMGAWLAETGFVRVRELTVPAVSPLILADRPG